MRHAGAAVLALALLAGPALAQETPGPDLLPPPVVVVDTERLFAESAYADRLRAAIEAEAAILRAENDDLVTALTAEERALTDRRPTMSPEAFRAEAEAFDAKVQRIRAERDAKEATLQQQRADIRVEFFDAIRPILGRLMVERGALVTLDSRSVVVAVRAVDLTDRALAEIDAVLTRDGVDPGETASPDLAPEPVPTDEPGAETQDPPDIDALDD